MRTLLTVIPTNLIAVLLMAKTTAFTVIVMVNPNDIRLEVLPTNVLFRKTFTTPPGTCFLLITLESVIVLAGESIVVSVKVGTSGTFGII